MRYANRAFRFVKATLLWNRNPIRMLADAYRYMHLEQRKNDSPVQQIWPHDQELLQNALEFYDRLEKEYLGLNCEADFLRSMQNSYISQKDAYQNFEQALSKKSAYKVKISAEELEKIQSTHKAWQLALPLLDLLLYAGKRSGILDIEMDNNLCPVFPQKFLSQTDTKEGQKGEWWKALSPPPPRTADTIVAEAGGMFYAQESPEHPPYIEVGTHFKKGDPLYIIEVMKMFNKVYAEFSGKVTEVLLIKEKQGKVVKKGQPLFRVKPDEAFHIETEDEKKNRRQKATEELWQEIQARVRR